MEWAPVGVFAVKKHETEELEVKEEEANEAEIKKEPQQPVSNKKADSGWFALLLMYCYMEYSCIMFLRAIMYPC